MKSKLFLSLSLLTAVFSMNAMSSVQQHAYDMAWIRNAGSLSSAKNNVISAIGTVQNEPVLCAKVAGILTVPAVAAIGSVALMDYMQPKVEAKPTYLQRAKAQVQAGCSSVKANVTKGYTLAMNNKGRTAGAVAVVAALGYAAYKSEIFGKSKAVVTTPEVKPTPVARLHKIGKHLRD